MPTGPIITSSRLASNLRSTKSFNSKSLTRATHQTDSPNPTHHQVAPSKPDQPIASTQNLEKTINNIANTIKNLADVVGSFEARFVNIENSIASLTSSPQLSNTVIEPINAAGLSNEKTIVKKLDNLSAKMTIIETDLMLLKQNPKSSSYNNNNSNADDTASYETPFVSFSQPNHDYPSDSATNNTNSNRIVNLDQFWTSKSKLSSMSQGVLKENTNRHFSPEEETTSCETNDSLVSNDSTPKFINNKGANNLKSNFSGFNMMSESSNDASDAITRAKNLVLIAEKLNTKVKI